MVPCLKSGEHYAMQVFISRQSAEYCLNGIQVHLRNNLDKIVSIQQNWC
jgi:hypothetical protein